MAAYLVQMGLPDEPSPTSAGGFAVTFPFSLVPQEAVGTPLQSVSSTGGRITAKITGSLLAVWKLPPDAVLKIMSYVLRGHVASHISTTGELPDNATVELSTYSFPGPCPFDTGFLEELPGAPQPIAVNRRIGF